MLTPKQIRIFGLLAANLFREYTYKELKMLARERSNSIIQNAVKKFLAVGLIHERQIGTSKLYSINHKNDLVYNYIDIAIKENIPKSVSTSVTIIKEELIKRNIFASIVLFGSYADDSNTAKSDLDVAIFTADKKTKKEAEIALNSASNKTLIQIDFHVISQDEFSEMLRVDYENLGKEIARKNKPIYNSAIFYTILKRGVDNGFKITS